MSAFKTRGNIRHSTNGDEYLIKGYRESFCERVTNLPLKLRDMMFNALYVGITLNRDIKCTKGLL